MEDTPVAKPVFKYLHPLLVCATIIDLGTILFFALSASGAFRYWQAEKQPRDKTDLRFEAAVLEVPNWTWVLRIIQRRLR